MKYKELNEFWSTSFYVFENKEHGKYKEEVLDCKWCQAPYIYSACEYDEEAELCPSCEYKEGQASTHEKY